MSGPATTPRSSSAWRSWWRVRPDLIVASGDLTHRAKRTSTRRRRAFSGRSGRPSSPFPGNHDIPWTLRRLTRPFDEFERHWQTTEPVFSSHALHVVGLNSVRAWRHQSGGIRESQLAPASELFGRRGRGAAGRRPPPPSDRRAVALAQEAGRAADDVLAGLVDAGAELILAGHIHQGAVSERHEFEVVAGGVRGVIVSIAPGLGQPRPSAAARPAASTSTSAPRAPSASRPTSGATTTGGSPPCAVSRAAASPSPSSKPAKPSRLGVPRRAGR